MGSGQDRGRVGDSGEVRGKGCRMDHASVAETLHLCRRRVWRWRAGPGGLGCAGGGGGRARGFGVGGWRGRRPRGLGWAGGGGGWGAPREGAEQEEAGEEHDKGQQQVRVAQRVGAIAEVEPASFDCTRALYCTAGEVSAVGRACQPHRACAPKAVTPLRTVRHVWSRCARGAPVLAGSCSPVGWPCVVVACGGRHMWSPCGDSCHPAWSLRRGAVRGGSSETCTRASPRPVGPRGCHPLLSPSPAPHASSRSDSAARRRPRRSRPASLAR